jgi:signal transduction histidine kinase
MEIIVHAKSSSPLQMPKWQRYLPIILSVTVGIILSITAYYFVKEWEELGIRTNFDKAAEDRTFVVQRSLQHKIELLQTVESFFRAQYPDITAEKFNAFTTPYLNRYPELQALEWIPRVKVIEHDSFETQARMTYPDFQIMENDDKNALIPVSKRPEYFPLYFIAPKDGYEGLRGLDIGADSNRQEVLQRARDTGEVMAISHVSFNAGTVSQHGMLALVPVYRPDLDPQRATALQRHDALIGFIAGIFHVGSILDSAMTYLDPRPIDIRVYDVSPDIESQFLYFHPGQLDDKILEKLGDELDMEDPLNMEVMKNFHMAGRTWSVTCTPAPGYYLTTGSGWQALSVLILGLLGTFALAIYFYGAMRLAYHMAEAAEAANHAQSRFLAGMSHQLRTPLNAIIGYSELIREEAEDLDDPTLVQDVEKIYISGRYLLSLSDGILDLSKIKSGKVEVHSETCKITNLVDEIHSIASLLVKKNGNSLHINCPDDIGTMQTDVTRLHQILFSLVNNASDATEHGQITLDVGRENRNNQDWVRFSVKDSGQGMSTEQREWLEEMLSHKENTETPEGEEIRIGLLISSHFWQMMGGFLHIDSKMGEGSTFSLYLPAHMPANISVNV